MMKETIAQAAAEALNEMWAGETHDGEKWRADGHEAQTIAAAVITAQQQTAAARDALNEARLLLVELLADKGGLIKHAPGAWAMGGALEMRLRGLLATPADPGAKLAEAIEQRDAAEAVVERVVALAAAWNDTPDYQPSDYDRGRVDQRHDMTIQLAEVVEHGREALVERGDAYTCTDLGHEDCAGEHEAHAAARPVASTVAEALRFCTCSHWLEAHNERKCLEHHCVCSKFQPVFRIDVAELAGVINSALGRWEGDEPSEVFVAQAIAEHLGASGEVV